MAVRSDPELGSAFLDLLLIGIVLTAFGVGVDLARGAGVELISVAPAIVLSIAYLVAALRLGVSPVQYLRSVTKRNSLPS